MLELSGIGNGARLQRLGIDVVQDLRGVGENLQDHLQLRMAYKVNGVRTLNTLSAHWWGKLLIGLQYALLRSGPMSMAPSQLGAFAKSDPDDASLTRPDLEYHVQPLSLDRFGEPLHAFNAFTASVCQLRPTSRGSVHIGSPDPHAAPLIAPNYLSTRTRPQVAANAMRLTRRIAAAPALARYRAAGVPAGRSDSRPTKNSRRPRAHRHDDLPSGRHVPHGHGRRSRRGGRQPAARASALRGLRVVDASVMPTITSGNTNSPTLMIAERASDMIRADRRTRVGGNVLVRRAVRRPCQPRDTWRDCGSRGCGARLGFAWHSSDGTASRSWVPTVHASRAYLGAPSSGVTLYTSGPLQALSSTKCKSR